MVNIPCFKSFRANLVLPKNNGGGSSPIDLSLASSTDKSLGAPTPSPAGAPLLFEAVRASNRLVLDGSTVTANFSSHAFISPTHTYAVGVFRRGVSVIPTVTGLVPSGPNVSVPLALPRDTFQGGTAVQIVLYESS